ncbi:MAG TPA: DUF3159 domain-containing protein [Mycobacteriales bacterium]|nr:DUF3159 domain-containing protein [Mycobacteriales bacterium]
MAEPDRDGGVEGSLQSEFINAIGGWRGALEGALPATAFVVVRIVTGGMLVPAVVAVAVGLGAVGLRRLHGSSPLQAWGGFFGLALAILIARVTGKGEGFFLPGIVGTAAAGVVFAASVMAGRPAVGFALATYDEKYLRWREHAPLKRACTIATAVWALTFFIRAGIATWVYRQPGDADGTLLIVINAVKWPLIAVAAFLTLVLVRRAGPPPEPDSAPPASS